MSDKTKRIISYGVSAVAYAALAVGTAAGWEFSWWQPVTAIIGFVGTTFGIETVLPKRKS